MTTGNPTCLYCGKVLTEQRRSEYHSDRPASRSQVTIPTGRYGYDGHGRFCTLRCGYRWAVRQIGGALPPMLDLDREASCGCTVRQLRKEGHRADCYYSSPDPDRERQKALAVRVEEMHGRTDLPPERFRG